MTTSSSRLRNSGLKDARTAAMRELAEDADAGTVGPEQVAAMQQQMQELQQQLQQAQLQLQTAPRLGARVYVDPAAVLIGDVELGDDVSLWPCTVVRGDVNCIRIGARTNVQDGAVLHAVFAEASREAARPLTRRVRLEAEAVRAVAAERDAVRRWGARRLA